MKRVSLELSIGFLAVAFSLAGFANAASTSGSGSANVVPILSASFFQDLDFGVIAPSQSTASTVKVLRGNNNSSICGAALTCLENGNRARIRIIGAPGHRFSLSDDDHCIRAFVHSGLRNPRQTRGTRASRTNSDELR